MGLPAKKTPFEFPLGPWANFFAPSKETSVPQLLIPQNWVNFFFTLLSPKHFDQAKVLIQCKPLISYISNTQKVGFSLPSKCPLKELTLGLQPNLEQDVTDVDPLESPPTAKECNSVRPKNKNRTVLVESEVRRSPRIQGCKHGYC